MFETILDEVPDYKAFYSVDKLNVSSEKLAQEHPDKVKIFKIGASRNLEDIKALRIGKCKKTALLFGFPHPNEPIGSMTLEYLAERVVEDSTLDKLDFTWFIVKCADPDGARLNEGWFKGPFTPLNYAFNFYRPPGYQQIEWTFPIKYKTLVWDKPIPETRALMKVMEDVKPQFMYSLHNSGFGGVYFYVSSRCKPLYPKYQNLAKSEELPLHLGEPEAPYMKKLAQAIFKMPTSIERYDFLKKNSEKDPAEIINYGTSSDDYARRVAGSFTLVCEMPYYYDKRVTNNSPSDVNRRKAVIEGIEKGESLYHFLKPRFEKIAKKADRKTRLFSSVSDYLENFEARNEPRKKHAETTKEYEGKATIAQEFDSRVGTKFYSMLRLGMTLRVVDQTLAINTDKELTKVKEEIFCKLIDLNQELLNEAKIEVIPIQKLVKIQIGSGLMIAHHLANR